MPLSTVLPDIWEPGGTENALAGKVFDLFPRFQDHSTHKESLAAI